jgi:thiamine kinase-like enzyme
LSVQKNSLLQRILERYPNYHHSIFTGTVGKNRKIIVELGKGHKSLVFVKVAISPTSAALIHNEFLSLSKLEAENFTTIRVPEILGYRKCEFLELSNVKPQNSKQPAKLLNMQVLALAQLNSVNHAHVKWVNMREKGEIESLINKIREKEKVANGLDADKVNSYMDKLTSLSAKFNDETSFSCGFSHGDFTPWNMYLTDATLHIYDWELSHHALPILFDLFHYVFQSEILVNHSDYSGVKNEIERVLSLSSTKALIKKFNVDVGKSFIFYVLYISSYYVDLYSDQKELHQQAFWLFDVWHVAATDVLSMNNSNVFD